MTVSELHKIRRIELVEIISQGEDSKRQFKRQFNSIDVLAVEIAAMLNSEGGQIIVGVSDSGEITGIEDVRKLNQRLTKGYGFQMLALRRLTRLLA